MIHADDPSLIVLQVFGIAKRGVNVQDFGSELNELVGVTEGESSLNNAS